MLAEREGLRGGSAHPEFSSVSKHGRKSHRLPETDIAEKRRCVFVRGS